jgi:DNA-binding SARP family transcriptional activator/pimeloyl-ACP methyl ester carboxylesterase
VLTVRVLGTIEVESDGAEVAVSSPKQRLLLAVLAAATGPVPRHRLVDALWGDAPPSSAEATVMGYVSRLRAILGADSIESNRAGYRLRYDALDAQEFVSLIGHGAEGRCRADLERALGLWRGDAFGELSAHPFLVGEVRRLHELRTHARLELASDHLEAGDTARPISMLETLVAEEPAREDIWVLLIGALLEAGRPADAARAAHRCRTALAESGLEPSSAFVDAEASAFRPRTSTDAMDARSRLDVGPVRYARSGHGHLAFQVVGGGPVDLVVCSYGSVSIDSIWDSEPFSAFIGRLASSCRVVLYDTRGIGLSDPIDVDAPPSVDDQADDLRHVVDAANASPVVVVGIGDGGPTAITYAVRHRDHLGGLILVNTFARLVEADDYPVGVPPDRIEHNIRTTTDPDTDRDTSLVLRNHAPSVAADHTFRRWWDRAGRRGASPATAAALWRVRYGADVRPLLDRIATPTLVVHRRDARVVPATHGAFLAERIRGARYLEVDGADQTPFTEGAGVIAGAMVDFSTALVAHV